MIGPHAYQMEFEEQCTLPEFRNELWQVSEDKMRVKYSIAQKHYGAIIGSKRCHRQLHVCPFVVFAKGSKLVASSEALILKGKDSRTRESVNGGERWINIYFIGFHT